MTSGDGRVAWRFGPYRLERAERRLLRGEEVVRLRPKVFETLIVLVENAGRLVEKEALLAAVWPDAVVEEGNIPHTVSELRKALGEGRTDQRYIETVPTRGYRFVADVEVDEEGVPAGAERGAAAGGERIRFATTLSGIRLAWASTGSGAPLVKVANWTNDLALDRRNPIWRHFLDELPRGRTLVRYDARGCGLSDRKVDGLTFESFVEDLRTVLDAAGLERFDLLGISQGCAVAIAYAARSPERVRRMVLHGGYAAGWRHRATGDALAWREGMQAIMRDSWAAPTTRQVIASLYLPGGRPEEIRWLVDTQRFPTTPEIALQYREVSAGIDVRELLGGVQAPTLVTHSRDDVAVPVEAGIAMADGIPGARFLPLDSPNHHLLSHEPAWPVFIAALRGFLAEEQVGGAEADHPRG